MLDLFSGIGGFSLAASWVWGDELEIVAFCEIDKFCQKVLRKHWPDVPIIEDIREVTVERIFADTESRGIERELGNIEQERGRGIEPNGSYQQAKYIDLLTGGFPCQPFSCAGKRKGRADDRFLWPEMLRVIREVHPTWVIAENVGGIFTQEQGVVFNQVLTDLENEGYEVQPFCIPACAKNAPHRRDRWWIVANARCEHGTRPEKQRKHEVSDRQENAFELKRSVKCNGARANPDSSSERLEREAGTSVQRRGQGLALEDCGVNTDASNSGLQRGGSERTGHGRFSRRANGNKGGEWRENWLEVATRLCRVAHGIPNRVDRLKALGNSIVPQVAYEIMKGIRNVDNGYHNQSAR
jgi:DNA (cytosine-5)-methyltransferase 1